MPYCQQLSSSATLSFPSQRGAVHSKPAWCLDEAACASKHLASCKTPRRDHPDNAGPAVTSNHAICPATNTKRRQEKACAIQVSTSCCPVNKAGLLVPAKHAIPCYIYTLRGCIHRIPQSSSPTLPAWISSHFLYKSTTLHLNSSFTLHTHNRIYLFSLQRLFVSSSSSNQHSFVRYQRNRQNAVQEHPHPTRRHCWHGRCSVFDRGPYHQLCLPLHLDQ